MDKKAFNTILASVMAGAMTIGVASFANEAPKKETKKAAATTTTKKGDKKAKTTTTTTEEHKDGADHKCGEGSCGEGKKEGH